MVFWFIFIFQKVLCVWPIVCQNAAFGVIFTRRPPPKPNPLDRNTLKLHFETIKILDFNNVISKRRENPIVELIFFLKIPQNSLHNLVLHLGEMVYNSSPTKRRFQYLCISVIETDLTNSFRLNMLNPSKYFCSFAISNGAIILYWYHICISRDDVDVRRCCWWNLCAIIGAIWIQSYCFFSQLHGSSEFVRWYLTSWSPMKSSNSVMP